MYQVDVTKPVPADRSEIFPPLALNSESLLWRYADQRMGLTGLAAGLLQLMHPGIGAGVVSHSNFFDDPWDRIFRSLPQIMSVIFEAPGEPAERAGRKVRNHHRRINGVDYLGRQYDALDPETYWFAHATFQYSVHEVAENYSFNRMTLPLKEQLYREGVEWYRRYDVPMDPVPPDYAAFVTKWSEVCTTVLEITPAADRALDIALNGSANLTILPTWTEPLQKYVITPVLRLTALGGMPPIVRDRFGLPWTLENQVELGILRQVIKRTWRFTPEWLRWGPQGVAGRQRERIERKLASIEADVSIEAA